MSKETALQHNLLTLFLGLVVGGLGTCTAQTEMVSVISMNELFSFSLPPDWVVEQHADGTGGVIANSTQALERFTAGEETTSGDMILNLTFTPAEVFSFVFIGVDPGSTTAKLAETLMPTLSGIAGSEVGETEIVTLEGGRDAAVTPVTNQAAEGALVLFTAAEGVIAFTTIVSHPGEFENIRETALAIAASVSFEGTVEQLFDAIEVPEPLPFTPV